MIKIWAQRLVLVTILSGTALSASLDTASAQAASSVDVPLPAMVPEAAAPPFVAVDPAAETAKAIAALLTAGDQNGMVFAEKRHFAAVVAFYQARGHAPVWSDGKMPSAAASTAIARLKKAAEDGLDPTHFALAGPVPGEGAGAADRARFDIALSMAVVTFAEEASGGTVNPLKISRLITRKPERVDPIAALQTVAASPDAAAALDGFNPPHEGFRRLKAKLAEVRATVAGPKPEPIAEGPTLKPGKTDPRVPALRARFELPAPTDPALNAVYDEAVVAAVKAFQTKAGLASDGLIGPRTLAVLNGEDRDEEGEILANMEMWRWMPRDLGHDYVLINIPEFMVRVFRKDTMVHEARVVVGTPVNQTPVFSDEMEYVVVNPYWHVPVSIKSKEMLPKIQVDPVAFFQRHGYEAVWNGKVIDPATVIWDENAIRAVAIRQPPSEANALGRLKFMFPNQHAVYLHDTPSRKLFDRAYRAYSHGCVRVHEPLEFARVILEGEPVWTAEKLKAMFGGAEKRIDLERHLKVHLAYFNVWVDEAGTLQMRDDLYGHTAKIKKALDLSTAAKNT